MCYSTSHHVSRSSPRNFLCMRLEDAALSAPWLIWSILFSSYLWSKLRGRVEGVSWLLCKRKNSDMTGREMRWEDATHPKRKLFTNESILCPMRKFFVPKCDVLSEVWRNSTFTSHVCKTCLSFHIYFPRYTRCTENKKDVMWYVGKMDKTWRWLLSIGNQIKFLLLCRSRQTDRERIFFFDVFNSGNLFNILFQSDVVIYLSILLCWI